MKYNYSESFQTKILGALARNNELHFSFRDIVKPKYFESEIYYEACKAIIDHVQEYNQLPTQDGLMVYIMRKSKTAGDNPKIYDKFIRKIYDIEIEEMPLIVDEVVGFARKAELREAIIESVSILETGDYTKVQELLDKALKVGQNIGDMGMSYFDTLSERLSPDEEHKPIAMLIPKVDKLLNGGAYQGELVIFLAPPNRGKSICLVNVGAAALYQGKKVLHITLEMSDKKIGLRYDARLSGKHIRNLEDFPKKIQVKLDAVKRLKGDLIIKRYPTRGATVDTIKAYIMMLQGKGWFPDLLLVDYGDIMKSSRTYSDKRFEEGSIFEELRGLAVELDLPVVTATQANRGSLAKKVVTMEDIAESFDKAKIADVIIALCQDTKEKREGKMRWFFAKNRDNASEVTVDMLINTDIMFFKQDTDADDDSEPDEIDEAEKKLPVGNKRARKPRN